MTSPAELIADLDKALADAGETIIIRRYTAQDGDPRPKIDLPGIKAAIRAVKAEELTDNIDQTASRVVVSPTGLASLLPLVPGDKVIIQGAERNIELPKPIFVQDVLVRVNLMVTG